MKKNGRFMRTLTADIHFYTAQMESSRIFVFIESEMIGGGLIKEITPYTVTIKNERFMRENCTFKYVG
ncbi:hypothetical protein [Paenibacillus polymyxa]|uniref:hypothetical protein n=1 Tax=Paenibacillus polymyxa TaxID=1406 RepID=UPI001F55F143|nr:hypothetical protein [Paenibacillus polymyxa]